MKKSILKLVLVVVAVYSAICVLLVSSQIYNGYSSVWIVDAALDSYRSHGLIDAVLTTYSYVCFYVVVIFSSWWVVEKCRKAPIFSRSEITDKYYVGIDQTQIEHYQQFVDRILNKIDIANYSEWANSRTYNKSQKHFEDFSFRSFLNQAQTSGLSSAYIKIMVYQYFLADTTIRNADKSHWVKRVLTRKRGDYFPDGEEAIVILSQLPDQTNEAIP